ncbi:MAG TPA: (2Fe-2S)-binding protein [Myxococcales bacterium]|nr:(2Fe-2S)-binding protein [Myxococcales bacterium]
MISFILNGKPAETSTGGDRPLLWVLRSDLGLTGTRFGCGEGQCGACSVLVDGRVVRSCSTPLRAVAGKRVTTIEGLAQDGRLHRVQQAFIDERAFQCGFCTPGMIVAACALLGRTPSPTRAEIVRHMDGNLCRCGSHPRILAAIEAAAKGGAR